MVVAVVRIREAIATTGEVHLKEANNVDRVDVAADEVVLIVIEAEVRTRIFRRSNPSPNQFSLTDSVSFSIT